MHFDDEDGFVSIDEDNDLVIDSYGGNTSFSNDSIQKRRPSESGECSDSENQSNKRFKVNDDPSNTTDLSNNKYQRKTRKSSKKI